MKTYPQQYLTTKHDPSYPAACTALPAIGLPACLPALPCHAQVPGHNSVTAKKKAKQHITTTTCNFRSRFSHASLVSKITLRCCFLILAQAILKICVCFRSRFVRARSRFGHTSVTLRCCQFCFFCFPCRDLSVDFCFS